MPSSRFTMDRPVKARQRPTGKASGRTAYPLEPIRPAREQKFIIIAARQHHLVGDRSYFRQKAARSGGTRNPAVSNSMEIPDAVAIWPASPARPSLISMMQRTPFSARIRAASNRARGDVNFSISAGNPASLCSRHSSPARARPRGPVTYKPVAGPRIGSQGKDLRTALPHGKQIQGEF
jgi:hypothetical protein